MYGKHLGLRGSEGNAEGTSTLCSTRATPTRCSFSCCLYGLGWMSDYRSLSFVHRCRHYPSRRTCLDSFCSLRCRGGGRRRCESASSSPSGWDFVAGCTVRRTRWSWWWSEGKRDELRDWTPIAAIQSTEARSRSPRAGWASPFSTSNRTFQPITASRLNSGSHGSAAPRCGIDTPSSLDSAETRLGMPRLSADTPPFFASAGTS